MYRTTHKAKIPRSSGMGFGCVLFVLENCFLYGKIVSGAQGFEKIRTSGLLEEIFWLFFSFFVVTGRQLHTISIHQAIRFGLLLNSSADAKLQSFRFYKKARYRAKLRTCRAYILSVYGKHLVLCRTRCSLLIRTVFTHKQHHGHEGYTSHRKRHGTKRHEGKHSAEPGAHRPGDKWI